MNFPCVKCGLCCKIAGLIPELVQLGYVGDDGACIYLGQDSECRIYDHRPEICDFKKVHRNYAATIDEADFYRMTAMACNTLIQIAGQSDLIDVEKI